MQVMILEEDPTLRTQIAGALASEGFDILSHGRLAPAKEAARRASLDVLVLGESVRGRLAHDLALLAEWRNPRLGAILLTDREGESDELFELIPSLQAVLGRQTGVRTLARLALAVARSQAGEDVAHGVAEDDVPGAEASMAFEEETEGSCPVAEEERDEAAFLATEEECGSEGDYLLSEEESDSEGGLLTMEEESGPEAAFTEEGVSEARSLAMDEEPVFAISAEEEEPDSDDAVDPACLPSFLRTPEPLPPLPEPDRRRSPTPAAVPHPAFRPAWTAAPTRRLHLA